MASVADLNAKISELNAAIEADEAADDQAEADMNKVITDLRAQLAAGATDLAPQIQALEDIKAKLHGPPATA